MSMAVFGGSLGNGRLIDRIVRVRAELAARRRRAREAAAIEVFNDHLLRDLGLRRDRNGVHRHLARF